MRLDSDWLIQEMIQIVIGNCNLQWISGLKLPNVQQRNVLSYNVVCTFVRSWVCFEILRGQDPEPNMPRTT
jgi:hypothetical protein